MFLAVQLESRLIYCLNKACLTASASVISHRTVLTGSRPLGWGWRGRGRISSTSLPVPLPLPLSVFGAVVVAESTAGALLSLTLNGERSWKFRVPGQIYLDRLSFEMHTCGPSEGHLVHTGCAGVNTLHLSHYIADDMNL